MLRIAVLLCIVFAAAAQAQLSGLYTCSNGNPGNAYDYGDIGAFFDVVETQGLSAPVILEVYDTGGTFTSTASYGLGLSAAGAQLFIPGISAMNTVTIRAASGNLPRVQGSGAYDSGFGGVSATIGVRTNHVRIEGLEVVGGVQCGIYVYGNPLSDTIVRRNRVHGVTIGAGINLYSDVGGAMEGCIIENNAIWNCGGAAGIFGSFTIGALAIRRAAPTTVVRHNTVIHNAGSLASAAFGYLGGSSGVNNFTFEGNVFVCSTSSVPVLNIASGFDPVAPNYNFYYATNGATFHQSSFTFPNFAAWQTSGRDAQGSDANPQLFSIALGTEDFKLQQTSPAIDAAVTSTIAVDIDGNLRPFGVAPDSGCSEYTGPPPEMTLTFNSAPVTNGGIVNVGNARTSVGDAFNFTIGNNGPGDLNLYANPPVAATPGTNCEPTTDIQTQPTATIIAPAATTSFTVFIEPSAVGPFEMQVSMPNTDPTNNPYAFTIQGSGVLPNAPAQAQLPAGSAFSGQTGGPFTLVVDPGASLSGASIELVDPDGDNISVTAIDPRTTAPTGIQVPGVPTPSQPVTLTWGGVADASNDPGMYTWDVRFVDAVNGTPVTATVTIRIRDLPPVHSIAGATSGNGTPADPYRTTFTQGDDSSVGVDLATVTDPNTSQSVSILNVIDGATNPATNAFQFHLMNNLLRIQPASVLGASAVGTHDFTVQLTDGTNQAVVIVRVLVYGASGNIVFTTPAQLPDAVVNAPYNQPLALSGAQNPLVFTLLQGNLPGGLNLSTTTGTISGTPLSAGAYTFTIRVRDNTNDTATQQFQLTVNDPPPSRTGGTSGGGGGGGCVQAGVRLVPIAVAGLLLALACTRRRLLRRL